MCGVGGASGVPTVCGGSYVLRKPFPPLAAIHTVALDFDGVFTDNKVWTDQRGREMVRCDRQDGFAFDLVRRVQRQGRVVPEFLILSTETNPLVLARARKCRLACHHGVGDKLAFMTQYLAARMPGHQDPFAGLMYVGNDLNDLPLMRRVGYAVAPGDAHSMVQDVAHLILPQKGGDGCVRGLIERLLGINELSAGQIDELISNR
jgi:YrbI family 3-deoxy-D-manno-octulosonate 8-phosphate phosphatase